MKILIVGGVAGGATAAARLRRLDEHAEIIMFERGEYISYANCGLPYYIGGTIQDKQALTLQTPEKFHTRYAVDVRIRHEVIEINPEEKYITVTNLANQSVYQESYDKLILSPGAEPLSPPLPGIDLDRVFKLRTIPDTLQIDDFIKTHSPKTAVIVGGGYIGIEMAENLVDAGLAVAIVEHKNYVIGPLDYEMACIVNQYLRNKGIRLLLNNGVQGFYDDGNHLTVDLKDGSLQVDMALMAIGVRPDSALAEKANLQLSNRGAIQVDQHMRTSNEHIYAVGDAIEVTQFVDGSRAYLPLAGPANKQGRIAADHICEYDSRYKGTQGSSILKLFDMTIAMTGLNERAAKAACIDYDKLYAHSPSHAKYYPGASEISIKVIYEKQTGRILGAQLIGGEGTDKRCDVLATAIRAGMTAFDLTELELCYAPPYSSAKDPVNIVGYAIENVLTEKVRQAHWHDLKEFTNDQQAKLLDIRTAREYAQGHIQESIHIPLDELRNQLHTLDKQTTYYVICHSGQRSYNACRILSQNGFACYNISGGYQLYHSILAEQMSQQTNCPSSLSV